jgi:nickel/cobalt exporter
MARKSQLIISVLLLFSILRVIPVSAHPADVYTHSIHITLAQKGLSLQWEVKPGPLLVSSIWFEADADQDDRVSVEEADRWANSRAVNFTATLQNAPFPLQLQEVRFPSSRDRFQSGHEFITISLFASWPDDLGDTYQLVLHNGVEEQKSLNWYFVEAENGDQFEAPMQKNGTLTLNVFDPTTQNRPAKLITSWDSSMPSLFPGQTGAQQEDVAPQSVQQNSAQELLLDLVRRQEFSISFYVFALAISLALGALHALTPGHGKTVVAAYLVGSRGTTWHAVVLGVVVTLTHTGSVFLLGIITLAASQYILPTSIIPLLEIVSGLLIVGLGLYLLWQRFQSWRKDLAHQPQNNSRKYSLQPSSSNLKPVPGVYKVEIPGAGSSHAHHHGDGKVHSHDVPQAITWRSLIALGVSGGLVPCPDAIAILLVAVAINRILLGLSLIVFFSLGLAVVLIVIGLLMVHSGRLFDRFDGFARFVPFMPIVSALIVLVLGIGLTYGAYVRARQNFDLSGSIAGGINDAQVLYLAEDENGAAQLFTRSVENKTSTELTQTSNGVVDYAVSPDRSRVAYILNTDDLENEIWMLDLVNAQNKKLSDCANAVCSGMVWSPDGNNLVYEHMSLAAENATGLATLWSLDMDMGVTQPVFQESQLPGANPRWSADGKWLSYATTDSIRLYNLETGEVHVIDGILGAAANWSPDGQSILYRDVIISNNQFVTQLFIYDLSSRKKTNINPDLGFENILAAWSPDGSQIAIVRRDLSVTRGDQIWLMQADGRDARALTNTPAALHGSLNWSPDGRYLLYDLYDLDLFPLESSLQMIDVDSAEITDLKIKGYNPRWIWP